MFVIFIISFILVVIFLISGISNLNNISKEFVINQYLKLKFEQRRTIIYVKNRPFRQCMYLLLNLPIDQIEQYDEIKSIDEAAVKLNRKMERNHNIVPPETEFWGHCSNLQAWTDNDYNTRILHRNLAFPLLKALADAGDPMAKRKFKEEIAMRYATGHPTVVRFLTRGGYLHYLTEDEFESILIDIDFPSIEEFARKIVSYLRDIENPDSKRQINLLTSKFMNTFKFSFKYLILIKAIEKIPNDLRQIFVEIVYNRYKNYRSFPILKFLNKAQINFENLDFKMVKYNERLIGILLDKKLNLRNKIIEDIAKMKGLDEIGTDIEELDLSNNKITKIKGLDNLENLKILNLKNNYIKKIEGIEMLKNLELIDLSGNLDINEIPESINKFPSLKMIKLTGCRINKFSESISRYFWMGQNFRYYTNFTQEDIKYYEKTHTSKAGINGRLYKNFVRWIFKIRTLMEKFKFTYTDLKNFEKDNDSRAICSVKPTKSFLEFLDDKKQLRITLFL